ncbi:MAG: AAA family ATPase [Clostridia bacterium]|nr:AAA family ATPase [Clostridia bacterium]
MDKEFSVTKVHIIRFGGLSQKIYTFKDGINIIQGDNRSGKTTLCEFIRFMLYGFEGRETDFYYPYNSENRSVCGSMNIKCGVKQYEISREYSASQNTLTITDTDRAQPFVLPEGVCPGEYFLGISSFLFDRSLYCPQDLSGIVSDGTLARCENEILSAYSGEENLLEVSKRLEQIKESLTNPERSGEIDLALSKREELEESLANAIIKQNDRIELEVRIDKAARRLLDIEKQIVLAKADIEGFHNMQVEENSRKIESARKELEKSKAEYEYLLNADVSEAESPDSESISSKYNALTQLKEELAEIESRMEVAKSNLDTHDEMIASELFTEQDFEEVTEKIEHREKLYNSLLICAITLFSLSAIFFAAVFMFREKVSTLNLFFWICGGFSGVSVLIFAIALILIFTKNIIYRKVNASNEEEFTVSYDLCRSHSQARAIYRSAYHQEKNLYEQKESHYLKTMKSLSEELELDQNNPDPEKLRTAVAEKCIAEAKIESARNRYEQAVRNFENLGTPDFISATEKDMEQLRIREKELNWLNAQHEELFDTKRSLEAAFSTAVAHTERPSYIKTRLNSISDRITEGYKDLTALSMAQHITEDTLKVMRFRIQQHLADGVKNTVKFALEENETFLIDDNYSLHYKNASHIFPIYSDSLSRSSKTAKGISRSLAQSATLALRFSLTEMLETDCACAVLDEPFAFIDNKGEQTLISKLSDLKAMQVLIFTSKTIPDPEHNYNLINI